MVWPTHQRSSLEWLKLGGLLLWLVSPKIFIVLPVTGPVFVRR